MCLNLTRALFQKTKIKGSYTESDTLLFGNSKELHLGKCRCSSAWLHNSPLPAMIEASKRMDCIV